MLIASILLLVVFLFFPLQIANSAKSALMMCLNSVVPSLFPFLVASKITILSRDIRKEPVLFAPIAKFFNISPVSVWAFLLGLICGYPIGAKTVCDLYEDNRISKREATLLLCFCNNGGPAFMIATVGGMFFNSVAYGVLLYVCSTVSAIVAGFILRFFQNPIIFSSPDQKSSGDLPSVVTTAISDGALTMLNISGVIIFFAALFEGLRALNLSFLFQVHPAAEGLFLGFFEITSGIRLLSQTSISPNLQLALSGFLMSFSGISVFFQMMTFSAKLKLKITPCIICKVLTGLLSMALCLLWFPLLKIS